MGVREEDRLVPAQGATIARVHLEDRVTWRLSIRKHFPAPARLYCSWDRPGATSAGQTTVGISQILLFFLNFKAAAAAGSRACCRSPARRGPHPIQPETEEKGNISHIYYATAAAPGQSREWEPSQLLPPK